MQLPMSPNIWGLVHRALSMLLPTLPMASSRRHYLQQLRQRQEQEEVERDSSMGQSLTPHLKVRGCDVTMKVL